MKKLSNFARSLNGTFDLRVLTENRQELYGVATLWIILFHSCLCRIHIDNFWGHLIARGNVGCEIFLFLSGICLYFSFHGNEQRIPFIKRRLIRLYVPIVLICTGYWLFQLIQSGLSFAAFGTLLANYLTLSLWITGDEQIWFVSLLMVVYLLYPYIYRFLFKRKRTGISLLILIAISVGLTLLLLLVARQFYESTEIALTRLPVFLIGCYFGRKVYQHDRFPRWFILVCVVVFCGSIALLNADWLHGLICRYTYLPCGISLTFLLAYLFHKIHWKPLHAVFRFLGNMSLELYLLNIILARIYRMLPIYHPTAPSMIGYLILLVVNIALAYIAYLLGKRITPPVQKWLLGKSE